MVSLCQKHKKTSFQRIKNYKLIIQERSKRHLFFLFSEK
ncbi:hypothetical protein RU99_GL003160 [Enterococcus casseliflavus]|nr:hypothetical protein RU99_GL003160 [Enterococcus casseliflavus]